MKTIKIKKEVYTIYVEKFDGYFIVSGKLPNGEDIGLKGFYDNLNSKEKVLENLIKCTENGFKTWKKNGKTGIEYESLLGFNEKNYKAITHSKEKFPIVYL